MMYSLGMAYHFNSLLQKWGFDKTQDFTNFEAEMKDIKRLSFLAICLACSLLACSGEKKDNTEEQQTDEVGTSHSVLPGFEVGQVWKYETREKEPESTLTILKIETYDSLEYIHISISGLKINNPRVEGGYSTDIAHLPYSREKLLLSVTELVTTLDSVPPMGKGYAAWKEAAEKGGLAPFAFAVKDAVEFVEVTMQD